MPGVHGWRYLHIHELADVVRGASPRPAGDPRLFNGSSLPWITVAEITRSAGIYLDSTTSMLTEEGAQSTRILPANTLLLTNSGATLGVPKISRVEAGANDGVAALLNLREVSREFAYFFLETQTRYMREVLAPGLGQPNLNTDLIGQLVIPVPPVTVQNRIVEIAQTTLEVIQRIGALLVAKRALKRGLMQQLLSGKRRFPDFRGQPWHYSVLDNHVVKVNRKNDGNTKLVLTVSGEHGLVDQRSFFTRNVAAADLSGYYLIKKGEFAYNRSAMNGFPYGAIKRLDSHEEGALSTLYLCFAISDPLVDSDFLRYVFDSGLVNRQLRPIVRIGARAHGLLNVIDEDFLSISIPLPVLDEQRRLATVFKLLDQELEELELLRSQFDLLKRGILSGLLSGGIAVSA
jgi:type I restriction enzyme S subunit